MVARRRLLARLDEPDTRAVLISGPPRSGRTTTAIQHVSRTPWAANTGWYDARGEHDFDANWRGLLGALAVARDQPWRPPRRARLRDELSRALNEVEGETCIVIDGLDITTHRHLRDELTELIEVAPSQIHFVLIGGLLPLRSARLQTRVNTVTVGFADLAFSPAELAEAIDGVGVPDPSGEIAAAAHARTRGWIGLLDVTEAVQDRHWHHPANAPAPRSEMIDAIATLVSPNALEALEHAALVEHFPVALLRHIFTHPDAPALVDELTERAILTESRPHTTLNAPTALSPVLRARLVERTSAGHVARLHQQAARWLLDHGHRSAAVDQAIAANDWTLATRLVREALDDAALGAAEVCVWLAHLPGTVLDAFGDDARLLGLAAHWVELPELVAAMRRLEVAPKTQRRRAVADLVDGWHHGDVEAVLAAAGDVPELAPSLREIVHIVVAATGRLCGAEVSGVSGWAGLSLAAPLGLDHISAATAAVSAGRDDEAVEHLEAAVERTLHLDAPIATLLARVELAVVARDHRGGHLARRALDDVVADLRDLATTQPVVDHLRTLGFEVDDVVVDQGINSLTDREREILGLMRSPLTLVEIARELSISPNTLKSHSRAIYRKLDVRNRRAAIEELDRSS